MSRKKKKAPLSYKEAWERKIRIKQNVTMIITALGLIVSVISLLVS